FRSHAVRHVDAIGLYAGSKRYRSAQTVPITLEVWTILKTTLAVLLRLPQSCANSVRHRASVLRQFSIASRQGLEPWSCGNSRAATFPRLRPKIAGETRETQSIVTVESQLGVSGADSTSCSSSRPAY